MQALRAALGRVVKEDPRSRAALERQSLSRVQLQAASMPPGTARVPSRLMSPNQATWALRMSPARQGLVKAAEVAPQAARARSAPLRKASVTHPQTVG